MLDKAVQGRQGERTDLVGNVNEVERPTGNDRSYALRRLRKDRPDLHAKVLAKELSPHAAMIEAGNRALGEWFCKGEDSTGNRGNGATP